MDLSWFIPRNFVEFASILFTALLLDFVYPYHKGIMYKIHPVHTAYTLAITLFRKFRRTKAMGVVIWFIVVVIHVVGYFFILYISNYVNRILWILCSSYILKVSISMKLLVHYVENVCKSLEKNNIVDARKIVSNIVRRNVDNLDKNYIASAAIESLFENIVDGYTSPLLYYTLLGSIGALIQRIANAMDSALGYKHEEFRDVGWFSAKIDTVINFIPARLTAILTLFLCIKSKLRFRERFKVWLENRKNTESINAGISMSAAAGCLKIRLEKIGSYVIAKEFLLPSHKDVAEAVQLAIYVAMFYVILMCLIYIIITTTILL